MEVTILRWAPPNDAHICICAGWKTRTPLAVKRDEGLGKRNCSRVCLTGGELSQKQWDRVRAMGLTVLTLLFVPSLLWNSAYTFEVRLTCDRGNDRFSNRSFGPFYNLLLCCVQARGLGIRLATPIPADAKAASRIKYRSRHKGFRTGEKAKMAAITGESIFGSGKESSAQARQKAVLVKAAKLGIKTKGMRLLKPDEGDAMRRQPRVASRTGGSSAQHPSPKSEHKTKKRHRHAESGKRAGGVDEEDRWRGNGTQLDVGLVDDGDESASFGSVPVRLGEENGGERVVASKKRRTRSSRPQPTPTTAAASSNHGLAAIASMY